MIDISISSLRLLETVLKDTPSKIPKVASRAMNRAIDAGKTQLSRSVRETYVVKHKDVLEALKMERSHPANLSAAIKVSGGTLRLSQFKVTYNRSARKPVLRVRVKKGSAKKIDNAFLAGSANGQQVYTRINKSRLPLRVHSGPSVPQMAGNESVVDKVDNRMSEVLDQRVIHEITHALRGG